MRLSISKSKNTELFYIIESTYINKKHSTRIVEKLGNLDEVKTKANGKDPYLWAKEYAEKLTLQEKENKRTIIKSYSQNKLISKNEKINFNCGYLFLQKIYYDLKLNKICNTISDKYQFKFDLNDILSKLVYGRIIFPSSKLKTFEESQKFLEGPNFEYHHIGRALEKICLESDFIQSELYKNSLKYKPRNNKILYYDLTNFFFEIEQEDDLRKYGVSKEHRSNPIVQFGLFMDGDGLPLCCDINPGNTNENKTLKPLEEKIIKDFELSKIVVCTDAGLASKANRKFNNTNNRKFITTQSIKKLKEDYKTWAFDKTGWKIPNIPNKTIDISSLFTNEELAKKFKDTTFYKERWIKEDGLEQRIIVTFSLKYKNYQEKIRQSQINRAQKLIDSNPKKIGKPKQNDFKRFIDTIVTTNDGEVAENNNYSINQKAIEEEAKYDGFYAVCTNLEDEAKDIVKVNHQRWEIEESFRLMKSEFKSRPSYLSREDRIKAHFLTCFIALVIYRYLEKKLDEKYTSSEIIDTLQNMNFSKKDNDYIPNYIRTDLTDELHEKFGFRTDYEIITEKNIKKIFKSLKI
ncbi:MAG: IS1634 family transposase [Bacilli bacterium]|nr:IS1634 family transposase [Bacilli bacterium]